MSIVAVITRPAHQAEPLAQCIRQMGGQSFIVPMLEILPLKETSSLSTIVQHLDYYDLAIFVSANAVHFSLTLLNNPPPSIPMIAIGPGTAKALQKFNIQQIEIPAENHTEGLLTLPSLRSAIQGKKIVLFCGENTRPLLKNTLSERGAILTEAFCYRRQCPRLNAELMLKRWQEMNINLIISTSSEGLGNLWKLFGKIAREWLVQVPLLVISPGMMTKAQQWGFKKIWLSPGADDASICTTIKRYYERDI